MVWPGLHSSQETNKKSCGTYIMLTVRIFYPATRRNLFDKVSFWSDNIYWPTSICSSEENFGCLRPCTGLERHAFLSSQLLFTKHSSSTILIFFLGNPDISQYSTCWPRLSWYVDQSSSDRQPTYRSPWSKRFFLKVFSMCGEEWYYNIIIITWHTSCT